MKLIRYKVVSLKLREAIERESFSIIKFAKITGVSDSYIYYLLERKRYPSPNVRGKILKALGNKHKSTDIFEVVE